MRARARAMAPNSANSTLRRQILMTRGTQSDDVGDSLGVVTRKVMLSLEIQGRFCFHIEANRDTYEGETCDKSWLASEGLSSQT